VPEIGEMGKQKHLSIIGNNCAENCCKRPILVQVIVEGVVTFLEHNVYTFHASAACAVALTVVACDIGLTCH